ncbi:MAG: hypothetical protein ABIQ95_11790 [Bdellovibrionia bacterium]
MKKLLLCSLVVSIFGLSAFADSTLECRDFSDGAFGGYEILFLEKPDLTIVAKVSLSTKELAQLACSDFDVRDTTDPILTCHEEYLNDRGYSVVLIDEEINGKPHAILSEVSFAGTKELANLPCRGKPVTFVHSEVFRRIGISK